MLVNENGADASDDACMMVLSNHSGCRSRDFAEASGLINGQLI